MKKSDDGENYEKDRVQQSCSHARESNMKHSHDFNDNKMKQKRSSAVKDSKMVSQNTRYARMAQTFKQRDILTCALQTAKLVKENNELQAEIDTLERKVDDAFQEVHKKFLQDFHRRQKLLKSVENRPKLVATRVIKKPRHGGAEVSETLNCGVDNHNHTALKTTDSTSAGSQVLVKLDTILNLKVVDKNDDHIKNNSSDAINACNVPDSTSMNVQAIDEKASTILPKHSGCCGSTK